MTSDIIVLAEHEKSRSSITMEAIDKAVRKLYGGWTDFPPDLQNFIEDAVMRSDFEKICAWLFQHELLPPAEMPHQRL